MTVISLRLDRSGFIVTFTRQNELSTRKDSAKRRCERAKQSPLAVREILQMESLS